MHPEAFAYVATTARRYGPFGTIAEYGGRNVNGSVRVLFPGADYVSIDPVPGADVDIVGDATCWDPQLCFAAVVCCEVLEHVPQPTDFIEAARRHLTPSGRLILTTATDPRIAHSSLDGGLLRPGEHYRNVPPEDLKGWLDDWDDVEIEIHPDRGDLYATAVKPCG